MGCVAGVEAQSYNSLYLVAKKLIHPWFLPSVSYDGGLELLSLTNLNHFVFSISDPVYQLPSSMV